MSTAGARATNAHTISRMHRSSLLDVVLRTSSESEKVVEVAVVVGVVVKEPDHAVAVVVQVPKAKGEVEALLDQSLGGQVESRLMSAPVVHFRGLRDGALL